MVSFLRKLFGGNKTPTVPTAGFTTPGYTPPRS